MGFGSQGHAHALNLKDSGVDVVVGLREGLARECKRLPMPVSRSSIPRQPPTWADVIMVLVPDQVQADPSTVDSHRTHGSTRGDALLFAHGFSIHFGFISSTARRRRCDGRPQGPRPSGPPPVRRRAQVSPPWLPSTRMRPAEPLDLALSYANAIGGTRAGVIETTFADEDRDRPVRRAGHPVRRCRFEMIQASFETLTDAGYAAGDGLLRGAARAQADRRPAVRGRYRVDATLGLGHGRVWRHHPRPEGGGRRRPKPKCGKILGEIQSGEFAQGVDGRVRGNGVPEPHREPPEQRSPTHPVEVTGKRLRDMMTFMVAKTPDDDV